MERLYDLKNNRITQTFMRERSSVDFKQNEKAVPAIYLQSLAKGHTLMVTDARGRSRTIKFVLQH